MPDGLVYLATTFNPRPVARRGRYLPEITKPAKIKTAEQAEAFMKFAMLTHDDFLEAAAFCAEAKCDGETALELIAAEREYIEARPGLAAAAERAVREIELATEMLKLGVVLPS